MDIIFFLLPPQITLGTLDSTPRQVSRVKSSTLVVSNSRPLAKHAPALGAAALETPKGAEVSVVFLIFQNTLFVSQDQPFNLASGPGFRVGVP
jgi:hypothetical protein